MFSKGRKLTRQLRDIERNQDKILKELEKLKKEKTVDILETQGKNNSEEQQSAWRQFIGNQAMEDAANFTKYFGFGRLDLNTLTLKLRKNCRRSSKKLC